MCSSSWCCVSGIFGGFLLEQTKTCSHITTFEHWSLGSGDLHSQKLKHVYFAIRVLIFNAQWCGTCEEPSHCLLPNPLQIFCNSHATVQTADQFLVVIPLCPSDIQADGQWHGHPAFCWLQMLLFASLVCRIAAASLFSWNFISSRERKNPLKCPAVVSQTAKPATWTHNSEYT